MKINKNSTYHFIERLQFFLLVAIAASLPLIAQPKVTNILIFLLTISSIAQRKFILTDKFTLLFLLFFFLHIIGVFYSTNTAQAVFQLDKKISFVLIPLALAGKRFIPEKQYIIILKSFVAACFAVSAICLTYATYRYLQDPSSSYFFYYPLVEALGLHPIYLAMYICLSCFILVYVYVRETPTGIKNRILFYLALLYMVIFMFLLSARAEILSFYIISCAAIMIYGYRKKKLLWTLGVMGALGCLFAILVFSNPTNRERFKEAINYNSEYTIDKQWGGRAERLLMWDCTLGLIRENPIAGVGPGDALDLLQQCYKDRNYVSLTYYEDRYYNAHNQYFQSMLDLGSFGLLSFICCLIYLFNRAIKAKDYLFLCFVSLFSIVIITESMLEVHKGIVFFTFFSSLFISRQNPSEQ